MRWLDTEYEMGSAELVLGTLSLIVSVVVYLMSDWSKAVLAWILTSVTLAVLIKLIRSLLIPESARIAAERAVDAFKNLYPDCRLRNVALRAIEDDLFVFSLWYEGPGNSVSKPPARRYFAVSKNGDSNVVELDQSDWRPRGLK